jgi:hypothetical protein
MKIVDPEPAPEDHPWREMTHEIPSSYMDGEIEDPSYE